MTTTSNDTTPDSHAVTSVDRLEAILGIPNDLVKGKIDDHIDDTAATFIANAPLAFVATSDAVGNLDVSPKGDPAGFVLVPNSGELLIPERKGNKLAFGLRNILATGRIGLIFVIPGQRETLRVNGSAELSVDPAVLEQLSAHGKPALLATRVRVDECFFHCAKAFIRSGAWDHAQWADADRSHIAQQFAAKLDDPSVEGAIVDALETDYRDELY